MATYKSVSQAKRIKKDFQKIIQESDLNIAIKCNLKVFDYLDVTLNLLNNTYEPCSKPNNEIRYIDNSTVQKNGQSEINWSTHSFYT